MTDLDATTNAVVTPGCCASACAAPVSKDAAWHRAARWARRLAWVSLVWMLAEGAIGLCQGAAAGSIALLGWALGSVVEGVAGVIVVWRFTGERTMSEAAERTAQKLVAVSFWLLAPYIAVASVRNMLGEHRSESTVLGIVVTALSLVAMPLLGRAKHRLAVRLGSAATAGEGTQNYLCAIQAAAVLVSLALTALWGGGWWLDPIVGLGVAGAALWQGVQSWRGDDCC